MRWKAVDASTWAMEIPGVGVLVKMNGTSANAVTSTFIPGSRIVQNDLLPGATTHTHDIVRENRSDPPLVNGVKANDIQVRPDPGAAMYYVEDPDY